jgi:hypothetical protein
MSERIDPDYNPSDKEIQDVARLLARSAASIGSVHYNAGGNGFQKWALGLMGALSVAAVIGGIAMYGRLTAIEISVQDLKAEVADLRLLIRTRP